MSVVCSCVLAQQQPNTSTGVKRAPVMIRVSSGVIQGLVLKKVVPDASDLKSIKNSEVRMAFEIDEAGKVDQPVGVEGDRALFERCAKTLGAWRFKPYLLNGHPIRVESFVYFYFNKGKAEAKFCSHC